MPDITRFSRENLTARRKGLKRRRQKLFWQKLWRQTAMIGLTVGCLSVATSSRWQLHSTEQITLSGNRLLPDEEIHELMAIDYPQSLLKVQPLELENTLTSTTGVKCSYSRKDTGCDRAAQYRCRH